MIRVYLSGPITPLPGLEKEELKERFNSLEKWLDRNYGHWIVINPLKVRACLQNDCGGTVGTTPEQFAHTWACYLRHDLEAMLKCDAICMLPGWQDSRGAMLEIHVAEQIQMSPYYALLDDNDKWRIA